MDTFLYYHYFLCFVCTLYVEIRKQTVKSVKTVNAVTDVPFPASICHLPFSITFPMRSRYIFSFLSGQSAVRIPSAICALVCSQFANSAAKSAIRHKTDAKKTWRVMGRRERGHSRGQSCRITCKFSTSPSIGWHGTSFDQKLTAQQYTEAFINVRRCRMQRCHWQMPSLSRSVYLSPFPSVPRWQHNKSSVN